MSSLSLACVSAEGNAWLRFVVHVPSFFKYDLPPFARRCSTLRLERSSEFRGTDTYFFDPLTLRIVSQHSTVTEAKPPRGRMMPGTTTQRVGASVRGPWWLQAAGKQKKPLSPPNATPVAAGASACVSPPISGAAEHGLGASRGREAFPDASEEASTGAGAAFSTPGSKRRRAGSAKTTPSWKDQGGAQSSRRLEQQQQQQRQDGNGELQEVSSPPPLRREQKPLFTPSPEPPSPEKPRFNYYAPAEAASPTSLGDDVGAHGKTPVGEAASPWPHGDGAASPESNAGSLRSPGAPRSSPASSQASSQPNSPPPHPAYLRQLPRGSGGDASDSDAEDDGGAVCHGDDGVDDDDEGSDNASPHGPPLPPRRETRQNPMLAPFGSPGSPLDSPTRATRERGGAAMASARSAAASAGLSPPPRLDDGAWRKAPPQAILRPTGRDLGGGGESGGGSGDGGGGIPRADVDDDDDDDDDDGRLTPDSPRSGDFPAYAYGC